MLPRNNLLSIAVILFILSLCETPLAQDQNFLLDFYQKHISVVDGNRCSMVPSCSKYASEAFKKHGMTLGWIMTCDRLVRCGRDEKKFSVTTIINHQKFIHDPVKANDFWWFEKEKSQ